MTNAPLHSQPGPRRLPVLWRDHSWIAAVVHSQCVSPGWDGKGRAGTPLPAVGHWQRNRRRTAFVRRAEDCPPDRPRLMNYVRPCGVLFHNSQLKNHSFRRAFTVLEMLVVITIIGFLAALALPHLPGMTRANSMTAALQQLLSDCALARQLAMLHRSPVYMVFVPPNFSSSGAPVNEQGSYNNLLAHQYGAYALVSLRSVGDQPGQANPQYLTEWKPLPEGVFIAPWMFAGPGTNVYSTNTLSGAFNRFSILPFLTNLPFPFPAVDAASSSGAAYTMQLPYIGFSPLGQLTTNGDQFIPLDRGRVLFSTNTLAAAPIEAPPGNAVNNCNIIHINWLTARAKIERNQQR